MSNYHIIIKSIDNTETVYHILQDIPKVLDEAKKWMCENLPQIEINVPNGEYYAFLVDDLGSDPFLIKNIQVQGKTITII